MKRVLLMIALFGVFGAAMWLGRTFPAANAGAIDLDLLWLRIPNLQVWSLLLGSISLGAFGASVILGFFLLRGWMVGRRYRKAIKRLESELHQLRSLPLAKEGNAAFAKSAKPVREGQG